MPWTFHWFVSECKSVMLKNFYIITCHCLHNKYCNFQSTTTKMPLPVLPGSSHIRYIRIDQAAWQSCCGQHVYTSNQLPMWRLILDAEAVLIARTSSILLPTLVLSSLTQLSSIVRGRGQKGGWITGNNGGFRNNGCNNEKPLWQNLGVYKQ